MYTIVNKKGKKLTLIKKYGKLLSIGAPSIGAISSLASTILTIDNNHQMKDIISSLYNNKQVYISSSADLENNKPINAIYTGVKEKIDLRNENALFQQSQFIEETDMSKILFAPNSDLSHIILNDVVGVPSFVNQHHNLKNVTFKNISTSEVIDLRNADVSHAIFEKMDMTNVLLPHDLSNVEFNDVTNLDIAFSGSAFNLSSAKFKNITLNQNLDLSHSKLKNSQFIGENKKFDMKNISLPNDLHNIVFNNIKNLDLSQYANNTAAIKDIDITSTINKEILKSYKSLVNANQVTNSMIAKIMTAKQMGIKLDHEFDLKQLNVNIPHFESGPFSQIKSTFTVKNIGYTSVQFEMNMRLDKSSYKLNLLVDGFKKDSSNVQIIQHSKDQMRAEETSTPVYIPFDWWNSYDKARDDVSLLGKLGDAINGNTFNLVDSFSSVNIDAAKSMITSSTNIEDIIIGFNRKVEITIAEGHSSHVFSGLRLADIHFRSQWNKLYVSAKLAIDDGTTTVSSYNFYVTGFASDAVNPKDKFENQIPSTITTTSTSLPSEISIVENYDSSAQQLGISVSGNQVIITNSNSFTNGVTAHIQTDHLVANDDDGSLIIPITITFNNSSVTKNVTITGFSSIHSTLDSILNNISNTFVSARTTTLASSLNTGTSSNIAAALLSSDGTSTADSHYTNFISSITRAIGSNTNIKYMIGTPTTAKPSAADLSSTTDIDNWFVDFQSGISGSISGFSQVPYSDSALYSATKGEIPLFIAIKRGNTVVHKYVKITGFKSSLDTDIDSAITYAKAHTYSFLGKKVNWNDGTTSHSTWFPSVSVNDLLGKTLSFPLTDSNSAHTYGTTFTFKSSSLPSDSDLGKIDVVFTVSKTSDGVTKTKDVTLHLDGLTSDSMSRSPEFQAFLTSIQDLTTTKTTMTPSEVLQGLSTTWANEHGATNIPWDKQSIYSGHTVLEMFGVQFPTFPIGLILRTIVVFDLSANKPSDLKSYWFNNIIHNTVADDGEGTYTSKVRFENKYQDSSSYSGLEFHTFVIKGFRSLNQEAVDNVKNDMSSTMTTTLASLPLPSSLTGKVTNTQLGIALPSNLHGSTVEFTVSSHDDDAGSLVVDAKIQKGTKIAHKTITINGFKTNAQVYVDNAVVAIKNKYMPGQVAAGTTPFFEFINTNNIPSQQVASVTPLSTYDTNSNTGSASWQAILRMHASDSERGSGIDWTLVKTSAHDDTGALDLYFVLRYNGYTSGQIKFTFDNSFLSADESSAKAYLNCFSDQATTIADADTVKSVADFQVSQQYTTVQLGITTSALPSLLSGLQATQTISSIDVNTGSVQLKIDVKRGTNLVQTKTITISGFATTATIDILAIKKLFANSVATTLTNPNLPSTYTSTPTSTTLGFTQPSDLKGTTVLYSLISTNDVDGSMSIRVSITKDHGISQTKDFTITNFDTTAKWNVRNAIKYAKDNVDTFVTIDSKKLSNLPSILAGIANPTLTKLGITLALSDAHTHSTVWTVNTVTASDDKGEVEIEYNVRFGTVGDANSFTDTVTLKTTGFLNQTSKDVDEAIKYVKNNFDSSFTYADGVQSKLPSAMTSIPNPTFSNLGITLSVNDANKHGTIWTVKNTSNPQNVTGEFTITFTVSKTINGVSTSKDVSIVFHDFMNQISHDIIEYLKGWTDQTTSLNNANTSVLASNFVAGSRSTIDALGISHSTGQSIPTNTQRLNVVIVSSDATAGVVNVKIAVRYQSPTDHSIYAPFFTSNYKTIAISGFETDATQDIIDVSNFFHDVTSTKTTQSLGLSSLVSGAITPSKLGFLEPTNKKSTTISYSIISSNDDAGQLTIRATITKQDGLTQKKNFILSGFKTTAQENVDKTFANFTTEFLTQTTSLSNANLSVLSSSKSSATNFADLGIRKPTIVGSHTQIQIKKITPNDSTGVITLIATIKSGSVEKDITITINGYETSATADILSVFSNISNNLTVSSDKLPAEIYKDSPVLSFSELGLSLVTPFNGNIHGTTIKFEIYPSYINDGQIKAKVIVSKANGLTQQKDVIIAGFRKSNNYEQNWISNLNANIQTTKTTELANNGKAVGDILTANELGITLPNMDIATRDKVFTSLALDTSENIIYALTDDGYITEVDKNGSDSKVITDEPLSISITGSSHWVELKNDAHNLYAKSSSGSYASIDILTGSSKTISASAYNLVTSTTLFDISTLDHNSLIDKFGTNVEIEKAIELSNHNDVLILTKKMGYVAVYNKRTKTINIIGSELKSLFEPKIKITEIDLFAGTIKGTLVSPLSKTNTFVISNFKSLILSVNDIVGFSALNINSSLKTTEASKKINDAWKAKSLSYTSNGYSITNIEASPSFDDATQVKVKATFTNSTTHDVVKKEFIIDHLQTDKLASYLNIGDNHNANFVEYQLDVDASSTSSNPQILPVPSTPSMVISGFSNNLSNPIFLGKLFKYLLFSKDKISKGDFDGYNVKFKFTTPVVTSDLSGTTLNLHDFTLSIIDNTGSNIYDHTFSGSQSVHLKWTHVFKTTSIADLENTVIQVSGKENIVPSTIAINSDPNIQKLNLPIEILSIGKIKNITTLETDDQFGTIKVKITYEDPSSSSNDLNLNLWISGFKYKDTYNNAQSDHTSVLTTIDGSDLSALNLANGSSKETKLKSILNTLGWTKLEGTTITDIAFDSTTPYSDSSHAFTISFKSKSTHNFKSQIVKLKLTIKSSKDEIDLNNWIQANKSSIQAKSSSNGGPDLSDPLTPIKYDQFAGLDFDHTIEETSFKYIVPTGEVSIGTSTINIVYKSAKQSITITTTFDRTANQKTLENYLSTNTPTFHNPVNPSSDPNVAYDLEHYKIVTVGDFQLNGTDASSYNILNAQLKSGFSIKSNDKTIPITLTIISSNTGNHATKKIDINIKLQYSNQEWRNKELTDLNKKIQEAKNIHISLPTEVAVITKKNNDDLTTYFKSLLTTAGISVPTGFKLTTSNFEEPNSDHPGILIITGDDELKASLGTATGSYVLKIKIDALEEKQRVKDVISKTDSVVSLLPKSNLRLLDNFVNLLDTTKEYTKEITTLVEIKKYFTINNENILSTNQVEIEKVIIHNPIRANGQETHATFEVVFKSTKPNGNVADEANRKYTQALSSYQFDYNHQYDVAALNVILNQIDSSLLGLNLNDKLPSTSAINVYNDAPPAKGTTIVQTPISGSLPPTNFIPHGTASSIGLLSDSTSFSIPGFIESLAEKYKSIGLVATNLELSHYNPDSKTNTMSITWGFHNAQSIKKDYVFHFEKSNKQDVLDSVDATTAISPILTSTFFNFLREDKPLPKDSASAKSTAYDIDKFISNTDNFSDIFQIWNDDYKVQSIKTWTLLTPSGLTNPSDLVYKTKKVSATFVLVSKTDASIIAEKTITLNFKKTLNQWAADLIKTVQNTYETFVDDLVSSPNSIDLNWLENNAMNHFSSSIDLSFLKRLNVVGINKVGSKPSSAAENHPYTNEFQEVFAVQISPVGSVDTSAIKTTYLVLKLGHQSQSYINAVSKYVNTHFHFVFSSSLTKIVNFNQFKNPSNPLDSLNREFLASSSSVQLLDGASSNPLNTNSEVQAFFNEHSDVGIKSIVITPLNVHKSLPSGQTQDDGTKTTTTVVIKFGQSGDNEGNIGGTNPTPSTISTAGSANPSTYADVTSTITYSTSPIQFIVDEFKTHLNDDVTGVLGKSTDPHARSDGKIYGSDSRSEGIYNSGQVAPGNLESGSGSVSQKVIKWFDIHTDLNLKSLLDSSSVTLSSTNPISYVKDNTKADQIVTFNFVAYSGPSESNQYSTQTFSITRTLKFAESQNHVNSFGLVGSILDNIKLTDTFLNGGAPNNFDYSNPPTLTDFLYLDPNDATHSKYIGIDNTKVKMLITSFSYPGHAGVDKDSKAMSFTIKITSIDDDSIFKTKTLNFNFNKSPNQKQTDSFKSEYTFGTDKVGTSYYLNQLFTDATTADTFKDLLKATSGDALDEGDARTEFKDIQNLIFTNFNVEQMPNVDNDYTYKISVNAKVAITDSKSTSKKIIFTTKINPESELWLKIRLNQLPKNSETSSNILSFHYDDNLKSIDHTINNNCIISDASLYSIINNGNNQISKLNSENIFVKSVTLEESSDNDDANGQVSFVLVKKDNTNTNEISSITVKIPISFSKSKNQWLIDKLFTSKNNNTISSEHIFGKSYVAPNISNLKSPTFEKMIMSTTHDTKSSAQKSSIYDLFGLPNNLDISSFNISNSLRDGNDFVQTLTFDARIGHSTSKSFTFKVKLSKETQTYLYKLIIDTTFNLNNNIIDGNHKEIAMSSGSSSTTDKMISPNWVTMENKQMPGSSWSLPSGIVLKVFESAAPTGDDINRDINFEFVNNNVSPAISWTITEQLHYSKSQNQLDVEDMITTNFSDKEIFSDTSSNPMPYPPDIDSANTASFGFIGITHSSGSSTYTTDTPTFTKWIQDNTQLKSFASILTTAGVTVNAEFDPSSDANKIKRVLPLKLHLTKGAFTKDITLNLHFDLSYYERFRQIGVQALTSSAIFSIDYLNQKYDGLPSGLTRDYFAIPQLNAVAGNNGHNTSIDFKMNSLHHDSWEIASVSNFEWKTGTGITLNGDQTSASVTLGFIDNDAISNNHQIQSVSKEFTFNTSPNEVATSSLANSFTYNMDSLHHTWNEISDAQSTSLATDQTQEVQDLLSYIKTASEFSISDQLKSAHVSQTNFKLLSITKNTANTNKYQESWIVKVKFGNARSSFEKDIIVTGTLNHNSSEYLEISMKNIDLDVNNSIKSLNLETNEPTKNDLSIGASGNLGFKTHDTHLDAKLVADLTPSVFSISNPSDGASTQGTITILFTYSGGDLNGKPNATYKKTYTFNFDHPKNYWKLHNLQLELNDINNSKHTIHKKNSTNIGTSSIADAASSNLWDLTNLISDGLTSMPSNIQGKNNAIANWLKKYTDISAILNAALSGTDFKVDDDSYEFSYTFDATSQDQEILFYLTYQGVVSDPISMQLHFEKTRNQYDLDQISDTAIASLSSTYLDNVPVDHDDFVRPQISDFKIIDEAKYEIISGSLINFKRPTDDDDKIGTVVFKVRNKTDHNAEKTFNFTINWSKTVNQAKVNAIKDGYFISPYTTGLPTEQQIVALDKTNIGRAPVAISDIKEVDTMSLIPGDKNEEDQKSKAGFDELFSYIKTHKLSNEVGRYSLVVTSGASQKTIFVIRTSNPLQSALGFLKSQYAFVPQDPIKDAHNYDESAHTSSWLSTADFIAKIKENAFSNIKIHKNGETPTFNIDTFGNTELVDPADSNHKLNHIEFDWEHVVMEWPKDDVTKSAKIKIPLKYWGILKKYVSSSGLTEYINAEPDLLSSVDRQHQIAKENRLKGNSDWHLDSTEIGFVLSTIDIDVSLTHSKLGWITAETISKVTTNNLNNLFKKTGTNSPILEFAPSAIESGTGNDVDKKLNWLKANTGISSALTEIIDNSALDIVSIDYVRDDQKINQKIVVTLKKGSSETMTLEFDLNFEKSYNQYKLEKDYSDNHIITGINATYLEHTQLEAPALDKLLLFAGASSIYDISISIKSGNPDWIKPPTDDDKNASVKLIITKKGDSNAHIERDFSFTFAKSRNEFRLDQISVNDIELDPFRQVDIRPYTLNELETLVKQKSKLDHPLLYNELSTNVHLANDAGAAQPVLIEDKTQVQSIQNSWVRMYKVEVSFGNSKKFIYIGQVVNPLKRIFDNFKNHVTSFDVSSVFKDDYNEHRTELNTGSKPPSMTSPDLTFIRPQTNTGLLFDSNNVDVNDSNVGTVWFTTTPSSITLPTSDDSTTASVLATMHVAAYFTDSSGKKVLHEYQQSITFSFNYKYTQNQIDTMKVARAIREEIQNIHKLNNPTSKTTETILHGSIGSKYSEFIDGSTSANILLNTAAPETIFTSNNPQGSASDSTNINKLLDWIKSKSNIDVANILSRQESSIGGTFTTSVRYKNNPSSADQHIYIIVNKGSATETIDILAKFQISRNQYTLNKKDLKSDILQTALLKSEYKGVTKSTAPIISDFLIRSGNDYEVFTDDTHVISFTPPDTQNNMKNAQVIFWIRSKTDTNAMRQFTLDFEFDKIGVDANQYVGGSAIYSTNDFDANHVKYNVPIDGETEPVISLYDTIKETLFTIPGHKLKLPKFTMIGYYVVKSGQTIPSDLSTVAYSQNVPMDLANNDHLYVRLMPTDANRYVVENSHVIDVGIVSNLYKKVVLPDQSVEQHVTKLTFKGNDGHGHIGNLVDDSNNGITYGTTITSDLKSRLELRYTVTDGLEDLTKLSPGTDQYFAEINSHIITNSSGDKLLDVKKSLLNELSVGQHIFTRFTVKPKTLNYLYNEVLLKSMTNVFVVSGLSIKPNVQISDLDLDYSYTASDASNHLISSEWVGKQGHDGKGVAHIIRSQSANPNAQILPRSNEHWHFEFSIERDGKRLEMPISGGLTSQWTSDFPTKLKNADKIYIKYVANTNYVLDKDYPPQLLKLVSGLLKEINLPSNLPKLNDIKYDGNEGSGVMHEKISFENIMGPNAVLTNVHGTFKVQRMNSNGVYTTIQNASTYSDIKNLKVGDRILIFLEGNNGFVVVNHPKLANGKLKPIYSSIVKNLFVTSRIDLNDVTPQYVGHHGLAGVDGRATVEFFLNSDSRKNEANIMPKSSDHWHYQIRVLDATNNEKFALANYSSDVNNKPLNLKNGDVIEFSIIPNDGYIFRTPNAPKYKHSFVVSGLPIEIDVHSILAPTHLEFEGIEGSGSLKKVLDKNNNNLIDAITNIGDLHKDELKWMFHITKRGHTEDVDSFWNDDNQWTNTMPTNKLFVGDLIYVKLITSHKEFTLSNSDMNVFKPFKVTGLEIPEDSIKASYSFATYNNEGHIIQKIDSTSNSKLLSLLTFEVSFSDEPNVWLPITSISNLKNGDNIKIRWRPSSSDYKVLGRDSSIKASSMEKSIIVRGLLEKIDTSLLGFDLKGPNFEINSIANPTDYESTGLSGKKFDETQLSKIFSGDLALSNWLLSYKPTKQDTPKLLDPITDFPYSGQDFSALASALSASQNIEHLRVFIKFKDHNNKNSWDAIAPISDVNHLPLSLHNDDQIMIYLGSEDDTLYKVTNDHMTTFTIHGLSPKVIKNVESKFRQIENVPEGSILAQTFISSPAPQDWHWEYAVNHVDDSKWTDADAKDPSKYSLNIPTKLKNGDKVWARLVPNIASARTTITIYRSHVVEHLNKMITLPKNILDELSQLKLSFVGDDKTGSISLKSKAQIDILEEHMRQFVHSQIDKLNVLGDTSDLDGIQVFVNRFESKDIEGIENDPVKLSELLARVQGDVQYISTSSEELLKNGDAIVISIGSSKDSVISIDNTNVAPKLFKVFGLKEESDITKSTTFIIGIVLASILTLGLAGLTTIFVIKKRKKIKFKN